MRCRPRVATAAGRERRRGVGSAAAERRKVSVFGAGSVGATVAYASLIRGAAKTLAFYDIDREKARAEVLDLNHGSQFYPTAHAAVLLTTRMVHAVLRRLSDWVLITRRSSHRPRKGFRRRRTRAMTLLLTVERDLGNRTPTGRRAVAYLDPHERVANRSLDRLLPPRKSPSAWARGPTGSGPRPVPA